MPNVTTVLLDYKNIGEYIDINVFDSNLFSGRFPLSLIADAIRVALLAKHGGVWLDCDTIILSPDAEKYFLPDKKNRTIFFGDGLPQIPFINTPPGTACMNLWLQSIKEKLRNLTPETEIKWNFLGNNFINDYKGKHSNEILIFSAAKLAAPDKKLCIDGKRPWKDIYIDYYFLQNHHLTDINLELLLLHNSWTPREYKNFSLEEFLRCDCTMTNVLAEALEIKLPPHCVLDSTLRKNKLQISKKNSLPFERDFFMRI